MFSTNVSEKSTGMTKHMRMLPLFLVAMVVVVLAAATPEGWAEDNGEEIPFAEANLFFELNDTDGDLGIHALIDGEPWQRLELPFTRKCNWTFVSMSYTLSAWKLKIKSNGHYQSQRPSSRSTAYSIQLIT